MKFGKLFILSGLFTVLSGHAQEIRIAASDLLADLIKAPLTTSGEEAGFAFEIDVIGSLPALDRLRANEVDLAIVASPAGGDLDGFIMYPFAYEVAVLAVNQDNPLGEATISQLGGIFGRNEELNFNTWGDLGLSGWGNRNIKLIAGAADNRVGLELFRHSVLRGGSMKSSIDFVRDDEVDRVLGSDGAAVAILSRVPTEQNTKVLLVSRDARSPAFSPTGDNVHYGDYPLRLPFYIVFHPRDASKLESVVRLLLEDRVADSLREGYLLPLPEAVRRKLLFDLDLDGTSSLRSR